MLGALNRAALTLLLVGGACQPAEEQNPEDHPPLLWEGERVLFGTDVLDDVCAGTIAWLDATVESIEAELALEPGEKLKFVVVESGFVGELCGSTEGGPVLACHSRGVVYSSLAGLERARHELVHASLVQRGIQSKPLFDEGIAAALDKDGGCLASGICASANLDALLLARNSLELWNVAGYTPAADLVDGLLRVHGPAVVLAFMAELDRDMSPEEVRSNYLEHFGSVIDEDFHAFMRTPFDEHTLAQRGCDSLIPLDIDGGGGVHVASTMDCTLPEVINSAQKADWGTIKWTFVVTPEQSGAFNIAKSSGSVRLRGCIPPHLTGSNLADMGGYKFTSYLTDDTTTVLAPGRYHLQWWAKFGATLDLDLEPPCIFETGGCPPQQQCTIWNRCMPEVENPAALGQPCDQQADAPLTCEAGARCMGGLCVAECDLTKSCGEGQACSGLRVCGMLCDLLVQDCEAGFTCLPTSDDNPLHDIGMGACIAAGEKEYQGSCDQNASECGPGLSCQPVIGTYGSECWIDGSWCCVPFCDATAAEPGCPEDMPTCDPIRDGPVGACRQSDSTRYPDPGEDDSRPGPAL